MGYMFLDLKFIFAQKFFHHASGLGKIFEFYFFSPCPWTWKKFLKVKVFYHAPGLRNFFEIIFSTMLLDLHRMPLDLEKIFRIKILSLCLRPLDLEKKIK